MQLLPLLVQLLAISTLENHGCEAQFLFQECGKKKGVTRKGERRKLSVEETVSKHFLSDILQLTPSYPSYSLSLGRGQKTNIKDFLLPSYQLLNTCSNDYIKFPITVTVLAWEDHGQSCQSKYVSLGFVSLNPPITVMDRNPFNSLLSTTQTHLIPVGREMSCSNRSPLSQKTQESTKTHPFYVEDSGSFVPSSWRGRGLIRMPLQLHTCETFTGTETAVALINSTEKATLITSVISSSLRREGKRHQNWQERGKKVKFTESLVPQFKALRDVSHLCKD